MIRSSFPLAAIAAALLAGCQTPAAPAYVAACGEIPAAELGPAPVTALGCANLTNLALMVADPRDLIQPDASVPAPAGDAAVAAAQRHRAGKTKPLPTVVGSAFGGRGQ